MNPKRNRTRDIGFYVLIFVLIACTVYTLMTSKETDKMTYSEVKDLFINKQVVSFVYDGTSNELIMKVKDANAKDGTKEVAYNMYSFSLFYDDLGDTIEQQYKDGIIKEYQIEPIRSSWWIQLIPYILLVGLMVFWVVMMTKANGGGGVGGGINKFGKARTRLGSEEKNQKTFADVAGADEEKEELQELVEFLKNPRSFTDMGARIPKGVLLVGPPGTVKTLLAKAVAGEGGVQFLSISGSDFVELYVGVGASRVRDLFEQAKKSAPSIIFIDEIDAVGRRRGAGLGGGHDEREQTLNQLLVEMDGFGSNEGVIVMAATNRQDILDPALLRPGRFDRQIYVSLPDVKGREEILQVHAKNKMLADDVDLNVVARSSGGFSGADLANLLNEAALASARKNCPGITMSTIEESILKVLAGPEKRSRINVERDRRITAFHEAGHAVAMYFLPTQDPVHQITIVPRGKTLGMTISLPEEDSNHMTRNQMREQIVALLGGRIAEQLEFDDISTGASNDLQRATRLAHDMIAKYGMSERIGAVSYDNGDEIFVGRDYERTKSYSEKTGGEIDAEMKRVIDEAYRRCTEILKEHYDKLAKIAQFLLENENMSRKQFEACMNGEEIPEKAESFFDTVEASKEQ